MLGAQTKGSPQAPQRKETTVLFSEVSPAEWVNAHGRRKRPGRSVY